MRVLFDQGTPVPLRHFLSSHTVTTVYEILAEVLNHDRCADPDRYGSRRTAVLCRTDFGFQQ